VSDKSARILVRVRLVENEVIPSCGKLNREVAGHTDIRAEVCENDRVVVRVGTMECQLNLLVVTVVYSTV